MEEFKYNSKDLSRVSNRLMRGDSISGSCDRSRLRWHWISPFLVLRKLLLIFCPSKWILILKKITNLQKWLSLSISTKYERS